MKKVAFLLAILLIGQTCFAYVQEYASSDIKTLQGSGYSQDTLKMVETARMLKQGVEKDYVPFYDRHLYSRNPVRKWYQSVKRYFDPATDDNTFGVREITFENKLMDMAPGYFFLYSPNDRYNRYLERDLLRLENTGKRVKNSNGIEINPPGYWGFSYGNDDSL